MAFQHNLKIGLAWISHMGDDIVASCLEGSSHQNTVLF